MIRRMSAAVAGVGAAMWPLLALAEGGPTGAASRALPAPHDAPSVMIVIVLSLLGLFAVGGIAFAYRRERHLDWAFQRPDAPHDEHH